MPICDWGETAPSVEYTKHKTGSIHAQFLRSAGRRSDTFFSVTTAVTHANFATKTYGGATRCTIS